MILALIVEAGIAKFFFEEALRIEPWAAFAFLSVRQNAALGVFGEEREIETLDRLRAFVRQLGADAAFVFEAADFVAAGAAVVTDQLFALGSLCGIVHETRIGVGRVGMLQRNQVARHVSRIIGR